MKPELDLLWIKYFSDAFFVSYNLYPRYAQ